jgi:hypothetical protein
MVHVCKSKVNNSEDETELMKCTNWWKTVKVFLRCSFGLLLPVVHVCFDVSGEPIASIFRVIESGSGGEYSIDTSFNCILCGKSN